MLWGWIGMEFILVDLFCVFLLLIFIVRREKKKKKIEKDYGYKLWVNICECVCVYSS